MAWTFPDPVINITSACSNTDGSYHDLEVATVDSNLTGAKSLWTRIRITTGTVSARIVSGSLVSPPSLPSLNVNKPMYAMIGVDGSGMIQYASTGLTGAQIEIIAYSTEECTVPNSLTTSNIVKTPSATGYQSVSFSDVFPETADYNFANCMVANAYTSALNFDLLDANVESGAVLKGCAGLARTMFFCPVTSGLGTTDFADISSLSMSCWGGLLTNWHTAISTAKTLPTTGWQDLDLSGDVPSNATAVILDIYNNDASTQQANVRPNGSTQNITSGLNLTTGSRHHVMMGLDANKILDIYVSDTDVRVRVLGYWKPAPYEVDYVKSPAIFVTPLLVPEHPGTYYVDQTLGDDDNDGLSTDNPWKTISKVNSSSFIPGDQILFKKGEVWREKLTVPSSGSAADAITIGAYGTGDAPIITAYDEVTGWTEASGVDYTADSNIQAYWYLEETSGTRYDGTANDNDLTDNNTVLYSSTHKQGTNSADFEADNSESLSRTDANLSSNFPGKNGTSRTGLTCGAWVNAETLGPAKRGIMCKGAYGDGNCWDLLWHSDENFQFLVRDSVGTHYIDSNSITETTGTWYHIVGRITVRDRKSVV